MSRYEVYATRWDDTHIVEELIPARNLEFSLPLSGHGTASFTATVEPGRSFWRPSIAPVVSGILVARDGVPVWDGWVVDEDEQSDRSFTFQAAEWGAFLERVPAVPQTYNLWRIQNILRDLVTRAAAIAGQDPHITVPDATSTGATTNYQINAWDDISVARAFTETAAGDSAPEWCIGAGGTLENPQRRLAMGAPKLGMRGAQAVLEWVEDTLDPWDVEGPPVVSLLGDLFPAGTTVPAMSRRGGNLLAKKRHRGSASSATQVIGIGSGSEALQLRRTSNQAVTDRLLAAGWPRLTTTNAYTDISAEDELQRRVDADIAAAAGLTTGYSLVTLDDDPDWTLVPRGSDVQVILDTDVYGGERPVGGPDGFVTRLLNTTVRVDDDGPAQVQWDTATVQEGV